MNRREINLKFKAGISMKKTIIILLVIIAINLYAQEWETQNSGVECILNSVCFIDSLNGWVVGDSSTILKTTNGGKNWQKQSIPIEQISFRDVQFTSKTIGYILCRNGLFLSSTDGGVSWTTEYIMPDSSDYFYNELCFVNDNEGWITGDKQGKDYGIGVILHTSDGGKTWNKQLEELSYIQTSAKFFSAIKFINNKIGWTLASDYFDNFSSTYVYKTEDGGIKWKNVGTIDAPERQLNIISNDTLWAGGSLLYTSFDAGQTWNIFFGQFSPAFLIAPIDGIRGWTYHSDFNSGEKRISYTNDAGKTWTDDIKWNGSSINDIIVQNGYVWIAGTNGLIRRRSYLITSVHWQPNSANNGFNLYPNYPNPFNPSTTIKYSIPVEQNQRAVFTTLKVYDVLGREAALLVNEEKYPGEYEVKFDASNLSSGVYFYRLTAGSNSTVKKMLLLR
jgi:photosystem II stability/assembly factor-like uncharacterized protein